MIERDGYLETIEQGRELIEEYVAEMESRKVVLPEEVALAIDSFLSNGSDCDYIIQQISAHLLGKGSTNRIRILKDYAESNGYDLISALVNSYTIEEPEPTPKEKAIQWVIMNGAVARGKSAHDVVTAIIS